MRTLAIIGAGNIGSRHLQAFGSATEELEIWVADPSATSLGICAQRWNEVKKQEAPVKVSFVNDISAIPRHIDFVIISTNSEHRLPALKQLLAHSTCKHILLEKFLFTAQEEYGEATLLINKSGATCSVNVVRRSFEAYQWLGVDLRQTTGPLKMRVAGNNWGMASNSIHFIDLFCFLCGEPIEEMEFVGPFQIQESKRPGYLEFLGTLHGRTALGDELTIECGEGVYDKIVMNMEKGVKNIRVEEVGSDILIRSDGGEPRKFSYPYQSQLTLRYFREAMAGKLSIPAYLVSAAMHLQFLAALSYMLRSKGYQGKWKIT